MSFSAYEWHRCITLLFYVSLFRITKTKTLDQSVTTWIYIREMSVSILGGHTAVMKGASSNVPQSLRTNSGTESK